MDTQLLTQQEENRYAKLQLIALDMARSGETAELEKMVIAGLPVNLCDSRGNSLLMLAAYHGWGETTAMLLEHTPEIDRCNDHGQTPLGGVAFKGNMELVSLLLSAGADVNADNGGGKTPLMFAAMFGHRQVVEYLLARGADPNSQTFLGISAQSLAKFTGAFRSLGKIFS
jgi:uncharacterized protein